MPTATLTCPHCSTSLTTTKAFSAGSRFRCPRCGAAFAVRPEDAPMRVGPLARPNRAADDEPRPRSGAWLILAGVAAAAVLLLGGAGVVLALHFMQPKKDAAVVAAAPTGNNPEGNTPQAPLPTPPDLPGGPATPLAPEPAWLPPEKQDKVNAAIDRGVAYLEKMQYPGGTWDLNHQTGMAALPGLTLLECGVPADDPHVQNAAQFVRRRRPGPRRDLRAGPGHPVPGPPRRPQGRAAHPDHGPAPDGRPEGHRRLDLHLPGPLHEGRGQSADDPPGDAARAPPST